MQKKYNTTVSCILVIIKHAVNVCRPKMYDDQFYYYDYAATIL